MSSEEKQSSVQRGSGENMSTDREMSIREAKDMFLRVGESWRKDFDDLVRVLRTSRVEQPIGNENYLHALGLTDLMLRHTHSRFCMLTGGAGEGFLTCLRKSFVEMLDRLKAHGGHARVIVVDGDAGNLRELTKKYSDVFQLIEATAAPGAEIAHFIVADDDMTREEEWHGPLDDTAKANEVKAKVYFSNRAKAKTLAGTFDAIWKVLRDTMAYPASA